ncbi:protein kinase activator Mob2 [Schizosaccharomyces cryophilus OY26]|uniref:Protein kinase activator Mob2 n=1 Tax=Schizosaccharomyces cryophilus (strain OY26 / ATCC MYA-4695 / CBS 11777 / NBRC 106824 / NRRL Y48691) TaxID=653667 RepID=S9VPS5_SCHCR|nr:protein kinase activator Mob2 [Schizosaccharomyces cryophilus OY26]EPY49943.1 protein kinase activator Mob2 [Schizosaccharomyces cryophilus OY26]
MFLLNSLRGITRGNRSKKHQNNSNSGNSTSGSPFKKSSTVQLSRTNSPSSNQPPLYLLQPFVRNHLVKGNFLTIVSLPKYVDLDEWLALNVYELFTYLNHFYDVFTSFCRVDTCPIMLAGSNFDYKWLDNNRKPLSLPAPQYIEYVLAWIENRLQDQNVFPTKAGLPFPTNFHAIVRSIYKQMFRVFAHIYYAHYGEILHLSLEAHWNSFFAHFIAFAKEFHLLDPRDTFPLKDLISVLEEQGNI